MAAPVALIAKNYLVLVMAPVAQLTVEGEDVGGHPGRHGGRTSPDPRLRRRLDSFHNLHKASESSKAGLAGFMHSDTLINEPARAERGRRPSTQTLLGTGRNFQLPT